MNLDFPALSIRAPWTWAILVAGKPIENRSQNFTYRGPIYLHASKGMTWVEYMEASLYINQRSTIPCPGYDEFRGGRSTYTVPVQQGGLVGKARIVDCIQPGRCVDPLSKQHLARSVWCVDPPRKHGGVWYTGDYGLVLENIETLPRFVPCSGKLGLWKLPADVLAEVARSA